MSAAAVTQDEQRVLLRDLASMLERTLQKRAPDCPVEWVNVTYESPVDPPTRAWEYHDSELHVAFSQGRSEGYMLHVYAQLQLRDPAALKPLFNMKLLCGAERAVQEINAVWAVLNSDDFQAATGHPDYRGTRR